MLNFAFFKMYAIINLTREKTMASYYITHITTEKNCNSILNSNTFKISKHTEKSNQWLGDGIYFWDVNDKGAIKLGKKLVKNKNENIGERIKSITIKINIDENNHLDLENKNKEEQFISIIKKSPLNDEEFIKLLKSNKEKELLTQKELNKVGKLFGLSVNLVVKVLKDKGKIIDLVSYSFYHKKMINYLFGKEELCYRQFCVKNPDIVNTINKENWDIEYI